MEQQIQKMNKTTHEQPAEDCQEGQELVLPLRESSSSASFRMSVRRKRKSVDMDDDFVQGLNLNHVPSIVDVAATRKAIDPPVLPEGNDDKTSHMKKPRSYNNLFLLCPDVNCRPFELIFGDDDDDDEDSDDTSSSQNKEPKDRIPVKPIGKEAPESPATFRSQVAMDKGTSYFNNSAINNEASPTGVADLYSSTSSMRQNDVYFWQRSLAWSDEDDSDSSDSDREPEDDIWHHLSFPNIARKDSNANSTPKEQAKPPPPGRRSGRRRMYMRTQRKGPHHHRRAASLNIFQPPAPVDNSSEIFWEEQVVDVDHLEQMARLSIRDG